MSDTQTVTAFDGERRIASGPLSQVAVAVMEAGAAARALVFDDADGRAVDLDFHAPAPANPPPRGPGRPKLGVTAREVTLMPRHWDWLAAQPGGASVALRRLVEAASRSPDARRRAARDGAYRFMSAMAGDRPGFEEACRALYAGDRAGFEARIEGWPADLHGHAAAMAAAGFD